MNMSLRNLRGGIPGGLGSVNTHIVTYVASQIKQQKSMYQCFLENVTGGTFMTGVTMPRQRCVSSGNAPEWHRKRMAVRGQPGKPGCMWHLLVPTPDNRLEHCSHPHSNTPASPSSPSDETNDTRIVPLVHNTSPTVTFHVPQKDFLSRALERRVTSCKHISVLPSARGAKRDSQTAIPMGLSIEKGHLLNHGSSHP